MTITSEIILNEKTWAKEAIDSLSLGKKPYETIVRVAKYYKNEGYSKSDLRNLVEQFMIRCDPSVSLIKWDGAIGSAVLAAEKYPLICMNGVDITKEEMLMVEALPGVLLQRLLFTLVCLAKYGNAVNPKNNNWVNRPQNEIFKYANINITSKRQSLMVNDLWHTGMVEYSKLVDNTNLRVLAICEGETEMTITDFRNLGNQYMKYIKHGNGYFNCEVCGLTLKQRSTRQKYCEECAEEINRSLSRDRWAIDTINRQLFKNFDLGDAATPV